MNFQFFEIETILKVKQPVVTTGKYSKIKVSARKRLQSTKKKRGEIFLVDEVNFLKKNFSKFPRRAKCRVLIELNSTDMRANKRFLLALGIIGVWSLLTYLIVIKNHDYQQSGKSKLHDRIVLLENEIRKENDNRKELISRYQNLIRVLNAPTTALPLINSNNDDNNNAVVEEDLNQNQLNNKINFNGKYIDNDINRPVIPVLVIACNRVSISRSLDLLIKYRPSREQFPIVVSQVSFVYFTFPRNQNAF